MTQTKTYLVDAIVEQDDERAFRELYTNYSTRLLACTFRFTPNQMIAEEMSSNVSVGSWKNKKLRHANQKAACYLNGYSLKETVQALQIPGGTTNSNKTP